MSYPPPQPPVAQKSKATPVIIAILAVVLLVCLGCAGFGAYSLWWAKDKAQEIVDSIPTDFPTDFPTGSGQTGGTHTVRYEVAGSGQATITWAKGTGGQDGETVALPWSKEITVNASSFGVMVSVIPGDQSTTLESCKISVDGAEKKSAKVSNRILICSYTHVS